MSCSPVSLERALEIVEEREAATPKKELRSFPPVTDTIDFVKQVDWQEVGQKCIAGINNCGLVIAVIGEKIHDVGCFLADVGNKPEVVEPSEFDFPLN